MPLCEACYDETDEAQAYRRHAAIAAAACERLGIPHGWLVRLEGYGAHPRAAEIVAEMRG